MPVVFTHSRAGDARAPAVRKYQITRLGLDGEAAATALHDARREAISHREAMLGYQKECSRNGDREGARFFKEEAGDAMKEYRAACLLLPWVAATPLPGDCPLRDPYGFPPELWPSLCHLERIASTAI